MMYDRGLECYMQGDAFTEQLDLSKLQTILRDKIVKRPDRQFLIQNHILNDSHVAPSLQGYEQSLKKARLADNLNVKLIKRPGPLELVEHNILQTDPLVKEALKDGLIPYERTSFDAESGGSLTRDGDDVVHRLGNGSTGKLSSFSDDNTFNRTQQCISALDGRSRWDSAVLRPLCQVADDSSNTTYLDELAIPLLQKDNIKGSGGVDRNGPSRNVTLGEHGFMNSASLLSSNRLDMSQSSRCTIADELMNATAQLLEGTDMHNECLDQSLSESFLLCDRNEGYIHYDNTAHRSCPLFNKASPQSGPVDLVDSRLMGKSAVSYHQKYIGPSPVDSHSTLTRSEPLINRECVMTMNQCTAEGNAFPNPTVNVNPLRTTTISNRSLSKKRQRTPDVALSKDNCQLEHATLGEHLNGLETHLSNGLFATNT